MKKQVPLSKLIRNRREAENITQSQLAARLGADVSAISRWERGARPGNKYLLPLAKFLGCPVETILDLDTRTDFAGRRDRL